MRMKLTADEKLMPTQIKGGPGSGRRAESSSEHADKWTVAANKVNTRQAHTIAAAAHRHAQNAHEEAYYAHPESDNRHHSDEAARHLRAFDMHTSAANSAKR